MGKRKNAHGGGLYCGPGGRLEHLETFEDAARRETREEAGFEAIKSGIPHFRTIR